MQIKATFTVTDRRSGPGSSLVDVVIRETFVDWEDRRQVRQFASESDQWLCRGPGHKVTTECVAFKPGELVQTVVTFPRPRYR